MPYTQINLWGDDIILDDSETLKKSRNKKTIDISDPEKAIKSSHVSLKDKMAIIKAEVLRILGHYSEDTSVIRGESDLIKFFDKAIENGEIAVDTETNNSLDPLTCKLMGLCLYTPGMKNTYVPVNHVNVDTGELLPNQVTCEQIGKQLQRLLDNHVMCIFHNGKFDYGVLYYTCGVKLTIDWDTMIGAQLLNENEPAGLKYQFRDKINGEQEKYSIEKLFGGIDYAFFDPELFALYASTDSYMTYLLYKYQRNEYEKSGNERLYNLFKNIEMPVVTITAEMEYRGIAVDKPFAERLSKKFHKKLDDLNLEIANELSKYNDEVEKWRLTPEANRRPINKKTGKQQKSLSEQLSDPVELSSALQLGIFLYNVLGVLKVGRDGKRATDEETLKTISDKLPLVELILKFREYNKLLSTYIDALPEYCNPRDQRVHAHFNQLGREDRNVVTGRMSSSDPSLQVIPARGDVVTIRCMFIPSTEYNEQEFENKVQVEVCDEVLLKTGYVWAEEVKPGDILDCGQVVKSVNRNGKFIEIEI